MDIIKRRQSRNVKRDSIAAGSSTPTSSPLSAGIKPKRSRKKKIFKGLVLLFLALVLLGMGAAIGSYLYVKTAKINGENQGRVNVMVLGIDKTAKLSDTIMIVSIDTRTGSQPKLAMISLPRDMQVEIPEYGAAKINAAYSYGENNNYPGGGLGLSEDTLEQTLDLEIHHYAVLNFEGFKDLVDAAGGVDIDVKQAIDDPFYPKPDYSGVTKFSITEGIQHMDGELALKYARSRYTTSDFDRAARQQQIILALKDKIISPETLWHPSRIEKIQNAVAKNSKTDLSVRQLTKLYLIFRAIQPEHISRHVIDSTNYLVPSAFGSSAYVPADGDFSAIKQFIKNIFSQSGNTLPEAQAD